MPSLVITAEEKAAAAAAKDAEAAAKKEAAAKAGKYLELDSILSLFDCHTKLNWQIN